MENRRRHKWDNHRRSQSKKPPRGTCSWQPTVPSWEKEFCKGVGSLDWETLLQMKKFMHLYENVLKWNDSAGEEAFCNAKKRFWAKINGLPCDISLPDPDLYIDRIDWGSGTDSKPLPDLESEPVSSNTNTDHDPVVIFGDSLLPKEAYSVTGWGDEDENFKVPANSSSDNNGSPWMQNQGNSFNNIAAIGWPGGSSNAWHFDGGGGPAGYVALGGSWGWNYNNNMIYEPHPNVERKTTRLAGGNMSGDSRVQGNVGYRHHMNGRHKSTYLGQQSAIDKRPNAREWNRLNSCGSTNHHAAITVGQTWNQ